MMSTLSCLSRPDRVLLDRGCCFCWCQDADDGRGVLAYCETDFNDLFLPKCDACNLPVKDGLAACGASWHRDCFVCTMCNEGFPDGQYFQHQNKPYCARDYWATFGVTCAGASRRCLSRVWVCTLLTLCAALWLLCSACGEIIKDNIMNALGKSWHVEHFVCHECHKPFPDLGYYPHDGHPYCEEDTKRLFCEKCPVCDDYVIEGGVKALGQSWHAEHLTCTQCGIKVRARTTACCVDVCTRC